MDPTIVVALIGLVSSLLAIWLNHYLEQRRSSISSRTDSPPRNEYIQQKPHEREPTPHRQSSRWLIIRRLLAVVIIGTGIFYATIGFLVLLGLYQGGGTPAFMLLGLIFIVPGLLLW